MKTTNETMVELYQILGRIFFAMAQADKVIRPEEIDALKKIVKEDWLHVDETFDEFASDSAYQIEIVFDYLVDNEMDAGDVLYQLTEFKRINTHLFNPQLKDLILKSANKIASSFARRNKSELVFLSQLQLILLQS